MSVGTHEAVIVSATATQIVFTIPPGCVSAPVQVVTVAGSATTTFNLTITIGSGDTVSPDTYGPDSPSDDGTLSMVDLVPYLRAMLKDSADDIAQIGLQCPTWADADLCRYLELARGEYSRQRPLRCRTILQTAANQQAYSAPAGARALDDVLWSPTGWDLDQITAMAAALAGGPGLLWGGGIPIVGQVYFDSPASLTVWAIIRQAWRNTFGGHWMPDGDTGFLLLPCPVDVDPVCVFYRMERTWADIPWEHRMFILTNAVMMACEALMYQVVAQSPAQGQKLNLGLHALQQMVAFKYGQVLSFREPGISAGRS